MRLANMTGKQSKASRRAERLAAAETVWQDEDYGISMTVKRGRPTVAWAIDHDLDVALMALPVLRQLLDAVEEEYVLASRVEGLSWDDIGWLLQVTGEAARKKHGPAEAAYRASVGGDL